MAFNFKKYTANNPLLEDLENIDQYAEDGQYANEEVTVSSSGIEMGQSKGPLQALEDAALNAKASNIELEDAINIVAQAYGKGMSRLVPSLTEK